MKRAKDLRVLKLEIRAFEEFKRKKAERSWAARRDFSGIVEVVEAVKKLKDFKVKVQVIENKESTNSLS